MSIGKIAQRALCSLAIAAGLGVVSAGLSAAEYPEKQITIIAPTAAGSLVDILARLVADGLAESTGQNVIVKNVGGAGGSIGVSQLVKSDPDGYTLGFVPANLTTLPHLYDIDYDVQADLDPIIQVAGASMVHYVNTELGITSEAEFIAYALDHPGELTFANAGEGSAANLAARLFESRTGIQMTAIPYPKLNLGVLDVVAGRVSTIFVSAAQGMQFVNDGKLRALGITGLTPNPGAPGVVSIAEQGVEGYEYRSWFGLMAPIGTPADFIERIHAEVVSQSQSDAFSQALATAGLEPIVGTPEEFAEVIGNEIESWGSILSPQ